MSLKSSKKPHPHEDLSKVIKKENGKKKKLNEIRDKESFKEILTDDVEDIED